MRAIPLRFDNACCLFTQAMTTFFRLKTKRLTHLGDRFFKGFI